MDRHLHAAQWPSMVSAGDAPFAERLAIQLIWGVRCWQERIFGWVPQRGVYPIEDSLQRHALLM